MLDEAAGILQAIRSSEDARLACALSMLATARSNLGRFDQALQPMQQSLAIFEAVLPPGSPVIAACREQLARIHEKRGDKAEAMKLRDAATPAPDATDGIPDAPAEQRHDT